MNNYICCQGYVNICGFRAGTVGEERCPSFCLCVEACCCNGCAVSASRIYVMDKYQLSSDPCDYRLIRINNCIQAVACICDIAALFDSNLRHASRIADLIADVIFHTVSGCMTAQVIHELNLRESKAGHVLAQQVEAEPLVQAHKEDNISYQNE